MDLLADLLRQSGLRRRLLGQRALQPGTAVQFPCNKSVGLHVVTHGQIYLHAADRPPLPLQAGDIAIAARGSDHALSTDATLTRQTQRLVASVWSGAEDHAKPLGAAPAADAHQVISGAYQFWHAPVHPFFRDLPEWFVLPASSLPRMGPLALAVAMLDEEVKHRHLGGEIIVHGLLDVIFTHALRELVQRVGADSAAGWSHAVGDVQIRQVVALLHADPAHAWTLDELASRVGLSRTVLAERFRNAMGDTPLNHLRTLRMQRAMMALGDSERTLEQVAQEVGYQDAFSFSKVFKRTVGVAPREFRRKDREDQSLAWRFQSA